MFRKKLSILTILLTANICFAETKQVGDWSYSTVPQDGACVAQTIKVSDNATYKLEVSISNDPAQVSSVNIVVENSNNEPSGLKLMSGKTNKSNNSGTYFIALEKNNASQALVAPIWKQDILISDLMADNSFDLEIINADVEAPTKEVSFSLKGSSKTMKSMAQDCLQITDFQRPYELSQLLSTQENDYMAAINDKYSQQLNNVDPINNLEDFLKVSQQLVTDVQSGYVEHQKLIVKVDSLEAAVAEVSTLEVELSQALQGIDDLNKEEQTRLSSNDTLEQEELRVTDAIAVDSAALPDLQAAYDSASEQYNAARVRTTEASNIMEQHDNDIIFYETKLADASNQISNLEYDLETTKENLSNAREDKRALTADANVLYDDLAVYKEEAQALRIEKDNLGTIDQRLNRHPEYNKKLNALDSIDGKVQRLEKSVQPTRRKIRSLEKEKSDIVSAIKSNKQKLKNIDNDISSINKRKQTNNGIIESLDRQRLEAHDKMVAVRKKYNACPDKNKCKELLARKEAFDKQILEFSDKALRIRDANNKADELIATKRQEKKSLPASIKNQEAELSATAKSISDLKSGISETIAKKDNLIRRKRTLKSELDRIYGNISEKFNRRLNIIKQDLGIVRGNIRGTQNEIDSVNAEIASLDRKVSSLRNQFESLNRQIRTATQDQSSATINLSDAQRKRDAFAASSLYKNAQEDLSAAEGVLSRAKLPYESTNRRLTNNENRINEIEKSIIFNNERLESIPAELEASEAKIDEVNEVLPSLKSELEVADQEVLALEALVTNVLDSIYKNETTLIESI